MLLLMKTRRLCGVWEAGQLFQKVNVFSIRVIAILVFGLLSPAVLAPITQAQVDAKLLWHIGRKATSLEAQKFLAVVATFGPLMH